MQQKQTRQSDFHCNPAPKLVPHHSVTMASITKQAMGIEKSKKSGLQMANKSPPISAMYTTRTNMMSHQTLNSITSGSFAFSMNISKKLRDRRFFFLAITGCRMAGTPLAVTGGRMAGIPLALPSRV
eukprot:CAMPEP_0117554514 /NCGR_PEP_ID=MMETSP0784-20121206/50794_1 /TAXON_ID=39447 /ORGANISM="" /LENGTH=126 /DNA_ID=CAMNT_0005351683 /DNA_START=55 /DNA_END=435 /DNA_ORIENTATION=+